MDCIQCHEKLILGTCPYGHAQVLPVDTIDQAMKVDRQRTLGDLMAEARDLGHVSTLDPTSTEWDLIRKGSAV